MSRISRYQESITKFFKTKSCIKDLTVDNKQIIEKIYADLFNITSIILLTTLNSQSKKYNIKFHGYYVASGIDILWLIINIKDIKEYFIAKFNIKSIENLCLDLLFTVTNSLTCNIDSYSNIEPTQVLQIYKSSLNYIDKNLYSCVKENYFENFLKPKKTEIISYKFSCPNTIDKYKTLSILPEKDIENYIEEKYGSLCKITLVTGWMMGLGNEKSICILEEAGISFGYLLKIAIDFKNLERDILNSSKFSKNIVVNLGIKKSFDKFMKHKIIFIEKCLILCIYTTTIKEIIDIIEKDIDVSLERSEITLRDDFSECSCP